MAGYKINEKDIESVIRYLKIYDPKNADREYAIQLLVYLKDVASEIVQSDIELAQILEKAFKKENGKENLTSSGYAET